MDLQSRDQDDIRKKWGDIMALLLRLTEHKLTTDVPGSWLPPSSTQIQFGQRYAFKTKGSFQGHGPEHF